jgi:hypothetical protein
MLEVGRNENRRCYASARKIAAAPDVPMRRISHRRRDLFPNRQIWSRGADFRTLAGLGLKRFAWYGVLDSEV